MDNNMEIIVATLCLLTEQTTSLLGICEKQQELIDALTKRIDKLEGKDTDTPTSVGEDTIGPIAEEEAIARFYEQNRGKDWGDNFL